MQNGLSHFSIRDIINKLRAVEKIDRFKHAALRHSTGA